MIILLYGPDEYRREEKKRELIGEFRKKHAALGIEYVAMAADGALEHLAGFAANQSLFDPAKLAVVENAYEAPTKQAAELFKNLAKLPSVTVVVSEAKKPVKALDVLIKKPALVQEFKPLEGPEWKTFIRAEAKMRGARLTDEALSFLAEAYQGDSWRVVTELEKLSFLSRAVTVEDLAEFNIELAPNFWGLLNRFKSPRLADRLSALEQSFASKEPAAKLFNILAYQMPGKLEKIAAYDLAAKSGKLDYEEIVLDLVL